MDLIAIVAMFVLSVALGLAGTRAIFEALFFGMTRVRLHASASNHPLPDVHLREAPPAVSAL